MSLAGAVDLYRRRRSLRHNPAGRLMGALKEQTQGRVRFAGVGVRKAPPKGLESLYPMQELSLNWVWPRWCPICPASSNGSIETAAAARLKPDVVVTVDAPSFTLALPKSFAARASRSCTDVAPQLRAWGG